MRTNQIAAFVTAMIYKVLVWGTIGLPTPDLLPPLPQNLPRVIVERLSARH